MARKVKKISKVRTKRVKDQISELKEEIRQLQETVGMLVSIVMEGMEEEEGTEPKNQDEEFTFFN